MAGVGVGTRDADRMAGHAGALRPPHPQRVFAEKGKTGGQQGAARTGGFGPSGLRSQAALSTAVTTGGRASGGQNSFRAVSMADLRRGLVR